MSTQPKLTKEQIQQLKHILHLIGEREMPSNNTETRLVDRSGFSRETVAWCLSVLDNEGEGWLGYDEHPRTNERGYFIDSSRQGGSLAKLYDAFLDRPDAVKGGGGEIGLHGDDEDPDDEWSDIDKDDDSDYEWS